MNYEILYRRFIEDRRQRPVPDGTYSERHHIIPRCDGGSDDPSNLIRLTARDHLFAHLILAKWKGGVHWYSLQFIIANGKKAGRIPTREEIRIAAICREQMSKCSQRPLSASAKQKLSIALRGRVFSPSTIAKMRAAKVGKRLSQTHRDNIGKSLRGKTLSVSAKAKIGAAHRGKQLSETTREKIRQSLLLSRSNG